MLYTAPLTKFKNLPKYLYINLVFSYLLVLDNFMESK